MDDIKDFFDRDSDSFTGQSSNSLGFELTEKWNPYNRKDYDKFAKLVAQNGNKLPDGTKVTFAMFNHPEKYLPLFDA